MENKERGAVILDAHEVINGERQDVYGAPEYSFDVIASLWSVFFKKHKYLDVFITAQDVALMMALFKIAREICGAKNDNIVDAIGYLGIYGDMQGYGKHC